MNVSDRICVFFPQKLQREVEAGEITVEEIREAAKDLLATKDRFVS